MPQEQKRIFVGNLPPDLQEEDIKNQFCEYGNVISVELKHRKDSTNETVSSAFAFVNIQTDHKTLNNCFRDLSDYNWDGYNIKLELAKESFLERLKREREEAKLKETDTPNKTTKVVEDKPQKAIDTSVYKRISNYKSSESSSESSSSESEQEAADLKVKTEKVKVVKDDEEKIDYVIKNNKFKHINGTSIKIDSTGAKPIHIIGPKKEATEIKDKKSLVAEEKRKKSISLMKDSYQKQKLAIRSALSSIDSRSSANNKIIFDDEMEVSSSKKRKNSKDTFDNNVAERHKVSLFDDGNEEDVNQIDFGIKKQFEGYKGQKLLELQSRFTNDKRFTLDARFLDEEQEEVNSFEPEEDEKQKQLDILESVLGRKITNKKPKETLAQDAKKPLKTMLRFDPSKPEHSKFEVKPSEDKKQKKKNKSDVNKPAEVVENPVDVSKETFYQVTGNLKETLQEKQPFSLLGMMGRSEDVEENNEPKEEEQVKSINKSSKRLGMNRNPFKYDSSDSENDEQDQKKITDHKESTKPAENWSVRKSNTETFFFQSNDERLQEGLDFLKKLNNETSASFDETRRKLKVIVRAKVRNVQRNNRPFRKKVARHKMIKVKKAKKK